MIRTAVQTFYNIKSFLKRAYMVWLLFIFFSEIRDSNIWFSVLTMYILIGKSIALQKFGIQV